MTSLYPGVYLEYLKVVYSKLANNSTTFIKLLMLQQN